MMTDEQLTGIVRRADAIVKAAELDPVVAPAVYGPLIQQLLAQHPESVGPAEGANGSSRPTRDGVAQRLGVSPDQMEYVYDTSGDDLVLVISRSRLPSQKARAMRHIALLYAAGRQAAYGADWTPVDAVRDQCRNYGVLDSPNFASALAAGNDAFVLRGSGAQRELKVTRAGFEEVAKILAALSHPA